MTFNSLSLYRFVYALLAFGITGLMPAMAQQNTISADAGIKSEALQADQEHNLKLDNEQYRIEKLLESADLQDSDRALFLAYQRLLKYAKIDVAAGMQYSDAVIKNYEKVASEALKDPILAKLPEGYLETLLPGLLETGAEAPHVFPR